MRCTACGFENPPKAKFCQECGTSLLETSPAVAVQVRVAEPAGISPGQGERRQLTVMFTDLVGSTELSARLDPEEWHDIVHHYHRKSAEVVERFGGYVAQYQGDGIIVYFGYPEAHEDDAERAVRAGLEIQAVIDMLNHHLEMEHGIRLAVRIGAHTGLVMMDAEGVQAGLVYGETPNLAARVQTAAEPNTVYITEATYRLVAGFFRVEDRGLQQLKGVPGAVRLYRVMQASGVRGRLHAAAAGRLTPYVGRHPERRLLLDRWEQVRQGNGQVVLITGDAGIGKSRLLQQFKADLGTAPHTWVEGGASTYQQNTPFAPIADLLQQAFRLSADAPAEERAGELERSFAAVGLDPSAAAPLVAPLLGLAVPGRYPPLLISPEQQRQRLISTLVDWVLTTARLQPLVLAMEDLHWTDPSTLELFGHLAERVAGEPVLLLFTARPSFHPPWPQQPHHMHLVLSRLNPGEVHEMIAGLMAQFVPSSDILKTLEARTDGVPLFAEELTKAVMESDFGAAALRQIPSTLNGLLTARLDRLGAAKEVAQVGAVLGREFSYGLLRAMMGLPDAELQAELQRLVDAELVYVQGQFPEATFLFKHVLVQDAAYGSLLKSRRRELHGIAARVLNQQFPELAAAAPELVAHHYTEAGEAGAAVQAWQTAGERAQARAALVEAAQHYSQAVAVLGSLPDTPERAQQELLLQLSLARGLEATKGFGSPEGGAAYARARRLAEQLGAAPQFFFVLVGLASSLSTHGEVRAAQEIADEILRLAERDGSTAMLTWAHLMGGIQAFVQGRMPAAWDHMQQSLSFYREEEHGWSPFNPRVSALVHGTLALWHLGLADQARQKNQEQIALAQRTSPSDLAMARLTACNLYLYLRDAGEVIEQADALAQLAQDRQLATFSVWATMYRGWALAEQGRHEEGIAQLSQGIRSYLELGTRTAMGLYLGMLAHAYLLAGDIAAGLARVEDALVAVPEEHYHVPEVLITRGDLYRRRALESSPADVSSEVDDLAKAEASFEEAMTVARSQGARAVELRAATHLGRLLQDKGRREAAHSLLSPLLAAFTEGLETRDLREAQALLDELKE